MPDSLKVRVGKALTKLGIPYQDVSDPQDAAVSAAYFIETFAERGEQMQVVVTLSRAQEDVWVQGGVDPVDIAGQPEEQIVAAIGGFDADLRSAPASLFSQLRLPKFRARGFRAHVSWSPRQRRIVSTVIIPGREFSSGTLGSSIQLAAHLCSSALSQVAGALQDGPSD